jgi:hypothetical protein
MRPCLTPECPALATRGEFCPVHAAEALDNPGLKLIARLHVSRSDPPELVKDAPPAHLWCFHCRKRLEHRLMVISGAYYDPEFFWRCSRCLESHTDFPR